MEYRVAPYGAPSTAAVGLVHWCLGAGTDARGLHMIVALAGNSTVQELLTAVADELLMMAVLAPMMVFIVYRCSAARVPSMPPS